MTVFKKIAKRIDGITLSCFVVGGQMAIIIYTIAVTILTTKTGNDYTGYFVAFCAVFGGEQAICAYLKKLKKRENIEDSDSI